MINIINLDDIRKLIDGRIEESSLLEYKRMLSKESNDIAKEVSAFANTDGGSIIYGLSAKDKVPIEITWLTDLGVEERIQNITASAIHPVVKGVRALRILNPQNNSESIYVVDIQKSLEAPHMVNGYYYGRHGSVSIPMDDNQVRFSMFGSGRMGALRFEISENLELAKKTIDMIDLILEKPQHDRRPMALILFVRDSWNSIIASGLLSSIKPELAERLVKTYRLVHEINCHIEWLKVDWNIILHTPTDISTFSNGTYAPRMIRDRIVELFGSLNNLIQLMDTV